MESYVLGLEAAEAGIPGWRSGPWWIRPLSLPEFAREAHRDYLWPALKYALKAASGGTADPARRDFRLASAVSRRGCAGSVQRSPRWSRQ